MLFRVSVIIPTYNCAQYLPEAIDSVLSQSYQDFEIVVVDDGSADDTKSKVREYIQKYPSKIRYFYQKNGGVSSARNRGIQESNGEYIAFLDSDDYFLPEFFEKCLFYLEEKNLDYVTPKCKYYSELDENNKQRLVKVVREIMPKTPRELYKFFVQRHVSAQTMLIKKTCFKSIGFSGDLAYAEDWDMWLKLAEAGFRVGIVPHEEPLWVYRVRKNSVWHDQSRESEKKRLMGDYVVLKRHKKEAFAIDCSLRKIYSERLLEISKNIFHIRKDNLLGMKILIESQMYHFDWRVVINLFILAANKTMRSICMPKETRKKTTK